VDCLGTQSFKCPLTKVDFCGVREGEERYQLGPALKWLVVRVEEIVHLKLRWRHEAYIR
jgi:hypothetical protein